MIYLLLKTLHVLFMAFWLAAIIKEIGTSHRFTGNRQKDKAHSVELEKQAGRLGTISGMGSILSGGALIFLLGFGNVPWAIYAGLLITVVMAFIGALAIGGNFHKIIAGIEKDFQISELEMLQRRLKNWSWLMLLLWTCVFLLMSLRHLF